MNTYMAYEAINTKILTRESRIFDKEKLEMIMKCTTVAQVAEVFKNNYGLSHIIEEAKIQELHRGDLLTLLNRFKVHEIEDLLHYFSGPYKDFLKVFLMESEIHDLVLILRKIARGEIPGEVRDHFIHSESYSILQYDKLELSKTVPQFIENLRNTPYYNALKTTTDNVVVEHEFHIEMKLQSLFYRTIIKKAEKLDKEDKETVDEIVGMIIDLLNAQWIYRAKKYYGILPEQILVYCLQNGQKLNFAKLEKLSYSKSVDEMKKLVNSFLRYNLFVSDNGFAIEKNMENYKIEYLRKKKFPGKIGFILSYIYLLDSVIKEFITITEGIRYNLPKEQLEQYLVWPV